MFNPGRPQYSKGNGFDMAVGFTEGRVLNASIGHWEMKYIQEVNGTENVKLLPLHSCRDDLKEPDIHTNVTTYYQRWLENIPNHSLQKKNSKFDIKNLMCTDGFNNNLTGDYFSQKFNTIQLQLHACIGKNNCASEEEVQNFLTHNQVLVIYKDTYNDKYDSKNFHKTYLNDEFHVDLEFDSKNSYEFYIRKGTIKSRKRFIFDEDENEETYQMGRIKALHGMR